MIVRSPSGFIEPCLPSTAARPPSGPLLVHEFKHEGYRLMVRRDGSRVRCFTRNGDDWADRFTAIVDAALRLNAQSFLIDEAALTRRRACGRARGTLTLGSCSSRVYCRGYVFG